MAGNHRITRMRRRGSIRTLTLTLGGTVLLAWLLWSPAVDTSKRPYHAQRCVGIGLDGMDPKLLRQFWDKGLLPNLKKLAERGAFSELQTSNPPQSPVAWASFATGLDPGGTEIFDFVHRTPSQKSAKGTTELPLVYESMSSTTPDKPIHIPLIDAEVTEVPIWGTQYRLPLLGGQMHLNRRGVPFWKYLEDADIPVTILHLPNNFPTPSGKARQLAGMGTPDMLGTEGVSYFFTNRKLRLSMSQQKDDKRQQLEIDNNQQFMGRLYGPRNELLRDEKARDASMIAEFTGTVDYTNKTLLIEIGDESAVLSAGQSSEFMSFPFVMNEYFWGNPSAIVQFHLRSIEPYIELYATPVQIDPSAPAAPVSTPPEYSIELAEAIGRNYPTTGMVEDNKAFDATVRVETDETNEDGEKKTIRISPMSESEFRLQCRKTLEDYRDMTRYEIGRYNGGFLFTYFRTTDVVSHMTWYLMDENHPYYDAEAAKLHGIAIEEAYRWVDEVVGEIMEQVGEETFVFVMSDHGFAPCYYKFNLNGWLADNGWMKMFPWADRTQANVALPGDIQWEETKAYALGLNCLYINLVGREAPEIGSVRPEDYDKTVRELCDALEAIVDPQTGEHVVTNAYPCRKAYDPNGKYVAEPPEKRRTVPDILVGFHRNYRIDSNSGKGGIPAARTVTINGEEVKTWARPNMERWSGDHCCDPIHVPGVLFMNRPQVLEKPDLTDLAPTILKYFGLAIPQEMIGKPIAEFDQKGS